MPTYDEKLLADAPEVTKADLQDGYNSELLREPTVKRTTSARVAPIPPRSNQYPLNDLESSAPLQPKEAPYDTGLGRKKQPFWRTTKGIVILGLVLLAIILAAVLGGVLGSRNHKNLSANNGAGMSGSNGNSGGNSTNDGGDGVSGGSANNGGVGVSGTLSSATTSPQLPASQAKHTATATQEIIGTPTGSTTSGNSGTTVSSGSDGSGSQPGASTGAGTTVGDTGAAQPPGDGAVPATF